MLRVDSLGTREEQNKLESDYTIPARHDGGISQGGNSGGDTSQSNSGYVLKVGPRRFAVVFNGA